MSETPKYFKGSWIEAAIETSLNAYDDGRSVRDMATAELAALRARVKELEKACKAAYLFMPLATDTIELSDCTICKDEWQSVIFKLRDALSGATPEKASE